MKGKNQMLALIGLCAASAFLCHGVVPNGARGQMNAEFLSLSRVLHEDRLGVGEKIRFTPLVKGEKSTAILIQARGRIRGHLHKEHDEFLYIIGGKGEMKVGKVVKKIKPKDLIYIPAGTPHEGFFEEPASILSVYSPQFDQENPDRIWIEGSP